MGKPIVFVMGEDPSYLPVYESIADPVRKHLPGSKRSKSPLPSVVNIHFVAFPPQRQPDALHVSLFHGLADKQLRTAKEVRHYDHIFVPGSYALQQLIQQGIPQHRMTVIGYPKLDLVHKEALKLREHKKHNNRKMILYTPTHSRSYSSYPAFLQYLPHIPKDWAFKVCPHPYDQKTKKPILKELAQADAVISDCSSVIYEAWALGIPVVFTDWLVKDYIVWNWPNSLTARIYLEQIGYHAGSFHQLINQVESALQLGMDERSKQLSKAICESSLLGKSGLKTAETLLKLASGGL